MKQRTWKDQIATPERLNRKYAATLTSDIKKTIEFIQRRMLNHLSSRGKPLRKSDNFVFVIHALEAQGEIPVLSPETWRDIAEAFGEKGWNFALSHMADFGDKTLEVTLKETAKASIV